MLVLLGISLIATCLIWHRIFRSDCGWLRKILHATFAAIPFFGPMLYVFLEPPSKHPPQKQMRPFPKGTEVYPSFDPLIKSLSGKDNEKE